MSPDARALSLSALELALLLLTGLVVGRTRARLALATLLSAVVVAVPLALPPEPAWLRGLMALASLFAVLRTIEVARDAREHATPLRMFAYVAPLDAFAVTRATPRLDARGLMATLGWSVIGVAGAAIVRASPMGPWRWPVACAGAFVFMLGAMDAASAFDRALLRAVGIESPPVQDAPILSRSVAELWSRRWNRAVGSWLRKHCFAPLARRKRIAAGVLASFAASAAIHFWPVLVAVGWLPALAMAGFFFAQAAIVALESRLGVARWPAAAGHAWTLGAMLLTSPLFTVPLLRVVGFA